jgi:hypothetical protein
MAKRRRAEAIEEPENPNGILIKNQGPIKRFEVVPEVGAIVELTGSNAVGKTEVGKSLYALATGDTTGLSLREGAEEGSIVGRGRTIKIMATCCKVTGQFDLNYFEEGFTLARLVNPGSTAKIPAEMAKTNDRQRVKDLATLLDIKIENEVIYRKIGGCEGERKLLDAECLQNQLSDAEYKSQLELIKQKERKNARTIISEKTTKCSDPAEFIASLKKDCDSVAIELEKTAAVIETEANTLEGGLPDEAEAEGAETDDEVLTQRVTSARNAKTDLERRDENAAEAVRLAAAANEILKSGQGQTVEQAQALLTAAETEEKESRDWITETKALIVQEETRLKQLERRTTDAQDALTTANGRASKIEKAQADLDAKTVKPTDEEWAEVEKEITNASAAMILGARLRAADETRTEITEKRQEAAETLAEAETLRTSAKDCLSLLIDPINNLKCGIEIDGDMRVVCAEHPIRGRCYFEELSDGEKISSVFRLMVGSAADKETPILVPLPQRFWLELDPIAQDQAREAVKGTPLMVIVMRASALTEIDAEGHETKVHEPLTANVLK